MTACPTCGAPLQVTDTVQTTGPDTRWVEQPVTMTFLACVAGPLFRCAPVITITPRQETP